MYWATNPALTSTGIEIIIFDKVKTLLNMVPQNLFLLKDTVNLGNGSLKTFLFYFSVSFPTKGSALFLQM